MKKILVIGAAGQIGTELVLGMEQKFGKDAVIASDVKEDCPKALKESNYRSLNVLDKKGLEQLVRSEQVTEIYLLAALLSATAEKNPAFAWELNMDGLFNVLNLAKEGIIKKIFWPSSIAVFGPTTPRVNTPQHTIMEPTTIYGISKQAGEQWCAYYHRKYGVDVRSIRYPGLISYTSLPGGGTTDYAVDIFYHAKEYNRYTCFLKKDTALPMMFMEDAIRATLNLMEAPEEDIKIRTSYNLSGISFTPEELAEEIKKRLPDFGIEYAPDFRQAIADSWPQSIDDQCARDDWEWSPSYDLNKTVDVMLKKVDPKLLF
ncbi:MAG: NAD-dependent epimerase/dehydratase family protein [Brumimicrobium sp.]|nr:NAD-dependent epimerase/dehydratase family protein [Brumimicrobium sp.]